MIELTPQDLPETMDCAEIYKVRRNGLTIAWLHCNRSHVVVEWAPSIRASYPPGSFRNWWVASGILEDDYLFRGLMAA